MIKKLILFFSFVLLSGVASATVTQVAPSTTLLDASNPNSNYSASTTLNLLNNDAILFKGALSSVIPNGQSLVYAHLYVWSSRSYQLTLNIYPLLRDFTANQVTWNSVSTGVSWGSAGATNVTSDYSLTPTTTYAQQGGNYAEVDITQQVKANIASGLSSYAISLRASGSNANATFDSVGSSNPPYIIFDTVTTGSVNTWYVRDGGSGTWGTTSTTCNATSNTLFTGSNGPNCAVNNNIIIQNGQGLNPPIWVGGDILSLDGDSDTSFAFKGITGVTTGPKNGDTYTNNGNTYTVTVTLPVGSSSGTLTMSGAGLAPTSSGTLTRATGSGDATITYTSEGPAQAMYPANNELSTPGGISKTQKTTIIGTGSQWPQIYANGAYYLLDAYLSHIDLEYLDITRHDNCVTAGPIGPSVGATNPDGYQYVCGVGGSSTFGIAGIQWGGDDLTMEHVLVHNLEQGFRNFINGNLPGGIIGNITLTDVKVFGNDSQGALMGASQAIDNAMTGTMSLVNSQIDFNGCGQRYPLQDTADLFKNIATSGYSKSVDNEANYYSCWGQNQGGYGDGYGYGGNSGVAGNWLTIGSSVSFNTSDGQDTLHGAPNGFVIVERGRFEGNTGQQLKTFGVTVYYENNLILGDCARWNGAPESSTTAGYNVRGSCPDPNNGDCAFNMRAGDHGFSICRANGSSMDLQPFKGYQAYVYNNTILANGIAIELGGGGCDATSGIHVYNNIVYGGGFAVSDGHSTMTNAPGNERLSRYIYYGGSDGDGSGTCVPPTMTVDGGYNIVYNNTASNDPCNASNHDQCSVDPGFSSTIKTGTVSITNGSNTVTGSGTSWTSNLVSEVIGFGTTNQSTVTTWYVVQSVNSSTSITLGSNYSGSNLTNTTYVIAIPMGTPTGPNSYYYHGTDLIDMITLVSTSPAIGAGKVGLTYIAGSNDFYNRPQNNPPDIGAIQHGSTFQACAPLGSSCFTTNDCCNAFCSANTCVLLPVTVPNSSSIKGALRGNLGR